MSVYKPKKSRFYAYDFECGGVRFFGSSGCTSRREALTFESRRREQAKLEIAARRQGEAQLKGEAPLTLDVATGRWWIEKGQHRADADNCWTGLERMLAWFGKDKRLDQLTDADVAQWVAARRSERVWGKTKLKDAREAPLVAPATVNRTTVDALRRIYGRARKAWKLPFANEPNWAEHRLPEPEERTRELEQHEQAALDTAAREGYGKLYRFARLSGLRLKTCLIPKAAVKWTLGRIEIKGKGGRTMRVPLSKQLRALLRSVWDDHDTMVFTYAAARPRDTKDGKRIAKGQRMPITASGLRTQWKLDRKRAVLAAPSLKDFRFHDQRHTAATRILRTTGNLKIAQRLLGHARISTTAKYAHVLDEEVLAAMNAVPDRPAQKRDEKSRTKSRTGKAHVA